MGSESSSEQVKDVYANFGLAIYHAQCLEHELVNSLIFLDLIPNQRKFAKSSEDWTSRVEAFMESKFEFTLGKMIRALSEVTTVDPLMHQQLSDALAKRNWLAHSYFRDRAESFLSFSGRESMLAELESIQETFCSADQALEAAVKPARERAGLTDEALAENYEKLRAKIVDDL